MRHERNVGVWGRRGDAKQMAGDAEESGNLLQLVASQFNKLAIGVARLRNVVGLEPAREDCGVVRVADAAVPPVPLRPQGFAGLGVELTVGREDEAGTSPGSEEPRAVQLARASQSDGFLALLHDRHTVDTIVGRAANLEDHVVGIWRLGAFVLAVFVSQSAVLNSLNLHPAGVQRHDLARLEFVEGVAP